MTTQTVPVERVRTRREFRVERTGPIGSTWLTKFLPALKANEEVTAHLQATCNTPSAALRWALGQEGTK